MNNPWGTPMSLDINFTAKLDQQSQQILKEIKQLIMATRQELNQRIDQLSSDIQAEAAEVSSAIEALNAKIAELDVPADFTSELERLNQVSENLKTIFDKPQEPAAPEPQAPAEEAPVMPQEPAEPMPTEENQEAV